MPGIWLRGDPRPGFARLVSLGSNPGSDFGAKMANFREKSSFLGENGRFWGKIWDFGENDCPGVIILAKMAYFWSFLSKMMTGFGGPGQELAGALSHLGQGG